MNLKKIWLFVLVCLMMGTTSLMAQSSKTSKGSKTTKTATVKKTTSKDSKIKKTGSTASTDKTASNTTASKDPKANSKDAKVKPAKNGNSSAAVAVQVHSMNRDEKNALSRCPVHNKHMSLSDNYDAEDPNLPHGDHYPFAYQLSYRRYCEACTNVMLREAKTALAENKAASEKDSQHCTLHHSKLKPNDDRSKTEFEKNPSADMPHAKQYLLKNYCTVCTKIYKIQHN